jgi:hypothetical protein
VAARFPQGGSGPVTLVTAARDLVGSHVAVLARLLS